MNVSRTEHFPIAGARVAILMGFLALFAYFTSVVFKPFPWTVGRLLFFAIGPLSVISIVGFYQAVRHHGASLSLQVGTVLHIVAGAILHMMAVVQDTQFTTLGRQIREAPDATTQETLTHVLWGVNVVQSGLDVSWDVFVSLGTVFLGIALLRHPHFGPWFAWPGICVAALALSFNLYTFPTAPADAGLIDLGPGVGLWYVAVLVQLARSLQWLEQSLYPEEDFPPPHG